MGFKNVAIPFGALLIGILLAFGQLGVEVIMMICEKKGNQTNESFPVDTEVKRITVDEIRQLLLENESKLNMRVLNKIRTLALSDG